MEAISSNYRIPLTFQEQRRGVIINPGKIMNLGLLAKEYFNLTSPFLILTKSDKLQKVFSNEVLRTDEFEISL